MQATEHSFGIVLTSLSRAIKTDRTIIGKMALCIWEVSVYPTQQLVTNILCVGPISYVRIVAPRGPHVAALIILI